MIRHMLLENRTLIYLMLFKVIIEAAIPILMTVGLKFLVDSLINKWDLTYILSWALGLAILPNFYMLFQMS